MSDVSLSYLHLRPSEFCELTPELVRIYIAAMDYYPDIAPGREEAWRQDALEEGFRAIIAVEGDEILGLAYGFLGRAEHWWTKQVRWGVIRESGASERHRRILRNFFELTEIHVAPSAQGRGIGSELLTQLLEAAPAPRVLLSTPEVDGEDNAAFRLYRRFAFEDFLRNFHFVGDPRPFAILSYEKTEKAEEQEARGQEAGE